MEPTNDPAALSGWSLSCAVAERLGWREVRFDGFWMGVPPNWAIPCQIDAYHEDETACFRDLLPVLAAKGFRFCHYAPGVNDESAAHEAEFYRTDSDWKGEIWSVGATAAEAISRAFLLATAQEPTDAHHE